MCPGEDPPERAQDRAVTPAVIGAAAAHGAYAFNEPAHDREQQIQPEDPREDAPDPAGCCLLPKVALHPLSIGLARAAWPGRGVTGFRAAEGLGIWVAEQAGDATQALPHLGEGVQMSATLPAVTSFDRTGGGRHRLPAPSAKACAPSTVPMAAPAPDFTCSTRVRWLWTSRSTAPGRLCPPGREPPHYRHHNEG